jgi:uncharacterized protein (DUF2249 family)
MSNVVPLDVRPLEPKDRYDRIMSAYESLVAEQALELTVDHDPKCMYYALRATRGEAAFTFEYLENGPETWRVMVGKTSGRERLPSSVQRSAEEQEVAG